MAEKTWDDLKATIGRSSDGAGGMVTTPPAGDDIRITQGMRHEPSAAVGERQPQERHSPAVEITLM